MRDVPDGLGGFPDSAAPPLPDDRGMKINEIMRRDVVTVAPQTSLKDVAALLVARRISGMPVCSEDGRVVGVISEADIVQKE